MAIVAACAASLHEALAATPKAVADAVPAIGVSAPGPLDPWRGVVVDSPNLGPEFHGFPLAERLEAALGLAVYLERDTNVAALAEQAYGAARETPDFLYLTVSTGFGGSIVSRGELILGPDGMAGELGHMQVELAGPRCACGGIGHVEATCSGRALAREAAAVVASKRSVFLMDRAARKTTPLDARDVAEGEAAGDLACRDLMARIRVVFAAACVSYVNGLNPSAIIVGGSIAAHQGDRLLQPARDAVSIGTFPVPALRVRIVPAELGDDVSLAGAQPLVAARHGDPSWRVGRSALPVTAHR